MGSYEAPAYILTIFQVLLGIIVATFGPMAKTYWAKAHLCDDGNYDTYMSRFKKMIYAIIIIFCLEAIITYVRIVFM